ncbi:helix-turn-helix domain-containing protein [Flavobacterium sp. FlaQc-48]|uniref:helix-turn-helix domain-containing protein n=1 Tax=Flavobacterium sp. FlaQc-48 TaxID=3374181 RepID=UPI0037567CDF
MNIIVGNRLVKLRKTKKWSQEQVAVSLHISQSAYGRMERGESASWAIHLIRICQIFEISPEDLVSKDSDYMMNKKRLTETGLFAVYRKIIKRYELQIKEMEEIIKDLKKE